MKIVANINIKIPEEGEKIKRLVELAKERNIDYKPSAESLQNLNDYIDRKGLSNPLDRGGPGSIPPQPPTYNPDPGFILPPPAYPPGGNGGFLPPQNGFPPVFIVPNQPSQPGFIGGVPAY